MKILTTQTELRAHNHHVPALFKCSICGAEKPIHHSGGTGYGYLSRDENAKPVCYTCCGEAEKKALIETGKGTLYLVLRGGNYVVTDWAGCLYFPCRTVIRGGNRKCPVFSVTFTGPDGRRWKGINRGSNQICRVVRQ